MASSIRKVAEEAGVSVGTVSNVLNGKASVAPEIADRVRAVVSRMGYVRDRHASRLRSGRSGVIGVIVPDLTNTMFAGFVSMIEHLARADGHDLFVVSTANDPGEEARRLDLIREWRPAGLIVIPCDGGLAGRVPASGMAPMVVADRIPDDPSFDLVAVENAASAAQMTAALAEAGVPDCLVVGTSLSISNVRERWQGAQAGARGTAMRLDLAEVGFADHAPPSLVARLSRANRPAALFCLDHETTLACYLLLTELGLNMPGDIALASFDEMEWMRLVRPAITAVRQPVEELAECAWTMLGRRATDPDGPPQIRRLRCVTTFRGSTPRNPAQPEGMGRGNSEFTNVTMGGTG